MRARSQAREMERGGHAGTRGGFFKTFSVAHSSLLLEGNEVITTQCYQGDYSELFSRHWSKKFLRKLVASRFETKKNVLKHPTQELASC